MNAYELLEQDVVWIDRYGVEHILGDMDRDYRDNVMWFLLRNAKRFAINYHLEHIWQTMLALDEHAFEKYYPEWQARIDREWSKMQKDPQRWMRMTPLYTRLHELNYRSVDCPTCEGTGKVRVG